MSSLYLNSRHTLPFPLATLVRIIYSFHCYTLRTRGCGKACHEPGCKDGGGSCETRNSFFESSFFSFFFFPRSPRTHYWRREEKEEMGFWAPENEKFVRWEEKNGEKKIKHLWGCGERFTDNLGSISPLSAHLFSLWVHALISERYAFLANLIPFVFSTLWPIQFFFRKERNREGKKFHNLSAFLFLFVSSDDRKTKRMRGERILV